MPSTIVCSGVTFSLPLALLSRNIVQSVAMAMLCNSWTNSFSAWSPGDERCAVAKPSRIRTDTFWAMISRRNSASRPGSPSWRRMLKPLM